MTPEPGDLVSLNLDYQSIHCLMTSFGVVIKQSQHGVALFGLDMYCIQVHTTDVGRRNIWVHKSKMRVVIKRFMLLVEAWHESQARD